MSVIRRFLRGKVPVRLLVSVLTLIFALLIWSVLIEPNRLTTNVVALPLESLDSDFGHVRIALIADLHVGSPWITIDKVRDVVTTVNQSNPDLILLAGDYVIQGVQGGTFVEPEPIASELKNLHAPLGVYAVLGNHDWAYNGIRITQALTNVNIGVLENNSVQIERNGKHFWLIGLADLWTRHPSFPSALEQVSDDKTVIAFTHNPDLFPSAPARVALTLAGHTHGGQVNIPFLGRLIVPSRFGQRYAIGHVVEDGKHLYVTPGIGTSILPVRFRVPPEITVLDL